MAIAPEARLAWSEFRRNFLRNSLVATTVAVGVSMIISAELLSSAVTSEISGSQELQAITSFLSEQLNVGLTAVGLVITFAAGFIVFNAFGMSVTQRLRDLARFRSIGMTQGQVLRMILLESSLAAILGTGAGVPLGYGLSQLIASLIAATSPVLNQFGEMALRPARLGLAIGMGLGITLLAAYLPARRAAQSSPAAVFREAGGIESNQPGPVLRGLLSVGLASLLLVLYMAPPADRLLPPWSAYLTEAAIFLWIVGIILAVPGWIQWSVGLASFPLRRLLGGVGWIGAQNTLRSRSRVTFTVLTLAVSVAMIVGVTGFITFSFEELFFRTMDRAMQDQGGLGVFPINLEAGMQAYQGLKEASVPEQLVRELESAVGERGVVVETYYVIAPQLSFMGDSYFSYLLDPEKLDQTRGLFFEPAYGDWREAREIMQEGCGLLVTPVVAVRNGVWLHDQMILDTPLGSLTCTIAGIGPTFVGASIISLGIGDYFQIGAPVSLVILSIDGLSLVELKEELSPIVSRYEGVWLDDLTLIRNVQMQAMETVRSTMNGMLLLAILSAAFGVVNTLMVNLQERRQELLVLRAVGATQRQTRGVLLVEAVLYGLVGGLSGLVMGTGLVLIYILISGAAQWGIPDFPVREAALASTLPALKFGLYGLVLSPLVTGLAAWVVNMRSKSSMSPGFRPGN